MKIFSKSLLAASLLASAVFLASPVSLAQEDNAPLSFEEEMASAVWRGVFDIGIPWSNDYWSFWDGTGKPIDMAFADSPEDVRAGRFEVLTRTGQGLGMEPIGNDGVAGLVAYGSMRDPDDPHRRWIKITVDDAFKWYQLPYDIAPDSQLFSLPPYGSGMLATRSVGLAETAGGATSTHIFAPPEEALDAYGESYGRADLEILEAQTVQVPAGEEYWDTGLEPETSTPKNVWVKVRIYDAYSRYGEMNRRSGDTKVIGEGWMQLFGPDGSYQIHYSPKGC